MKCTTELHGGACHRTSTPHKSKNKMQKKKSIRGVEEITKWSRLGTAAVIQS